MNCELQYNAEIEAETYNHVKLYNFATKIDVWPQDDLRTFFPSATDGKIVLVDPNKIRRTSIESNVDFIMNLVRSIWFVSSEVRPLSRASLSQFVGLFGVLPISVEETIHCRSRLNVWTTSAHRGILPVHNWCCDQPVAGVAGRGSHQESQERSLEALDKHLESDLPGRLPEKHCQGSDDQSPPEMEGGAVQPAGPVSALAWGSNFVLLGVPVYTAARPEPGAVPEREPGNVVGRSDASP